MDPSTLSEDEIRTLVRRAQDGDTDAFAALYDRFFDPVYRYTAFRLPAEIAEDVTADIFVKAWEKLHTYRIHKGVPFGAWLFRIARHSVIDTYRSHRGFEEVPEQVTDEDVLNHPAHRTEQAYIMQHIRAALLRLPRRYRDVLLLSYVADLPTGEVGRVLRLTDGAVRILKMRALRKLDEELPPDIGTERRNTLPD